VLPYRNRYITCKFVLLLLNVYHREAYAELWNLMKQALHVVFVYWDTALFYFLILFIFI